MSDDWENVCCWCDLMQYSDDYHSVTEADTVMKPHDDLPFTVIEGDTFIHSDMSDDVGTVSTIPAVGPLSGLVHFDCLFVNSITLPSAI
jgi:hypothetical protein